MHVPLVKNMHRLILIFENYKERQVTTDTFYRYDNEIPIEEGNSPIGHSELVHVILFVNYLF